MAKHRSSLLIHYSTQIHHSTQNQVKTNIIINNLNQEIKQLSVKFLVRFMVTTSIASLPSGHIDNESFCDNLHLNNEKGSHVLANTVEIFLGLKSKRDQRPSANQDKKQSKQSYAEITSTNPQSSTDSSCNIVHQASSNIHGNIPIQQITTNNFN